MKEEIRKSHYQAMLLFAIERRRKHRLLVKTSAVMKFPSIE